MTTDRDRLDEAIDIVARRLTRVAEDDRFAARIAASLPERRHWFVTGWPPRFAALAGLMLVVTSAIVVHRSDDGGTRVLDSDRVVHLAEFVPGAAPHSALQGGLVRRTVRARPVDDRRTGADHERSLSALSLSTLAAEPLVEDGLLSLESLSIADLGLESEFLSPIEE